MILFSQNNTYCDKNNKTTGQIIDMVNCNNGTTLNLATFFDFSVSPTKFWSIYCVAIFGISCQILIEMIEGYRDGMMIYFKSGSNVLDWSNAICGAICLICVHFAKDTAIWFGSTTVLFSWIIFSKAIGDLPVIGNWVYILGSTVKKLLAFLLVFSPLLFGFGLKFKFMFPDQVKVFKILKAIL